MKKGFFKLAVATATVITTLALSSVIAMAATHTLTADGDGLTNGETDGYFTAVGAAVYKESKNVNTFVLSKKGGNHIKFTPEGDGTVKVSFASTGGTNESVIDLCDSTVKSLEQLSVTGTTPTEATFTTKVEAGTTYTIANLGTSRDTRVASITVEEEGSTKYPDFNKADTDEILNAGKSTTATLDADITNATAGDTTGSADNTADTTTFPGFTVIGNYSETDGTFTGMTIESNSKSFDGVKYSNRLKTNGIGSTTKYAISFTVDKNSTVEVIGMSGNSSSTRPLVLANASGTELASHDFVGSTMSKASFSVTAGTYYLYASTASAGSNGGVNIYDIKVFDGVTYKLPVVTLINNGAASGKVSLTATVNSDFTAGEVTGIGFILAKPDATATTAKSCTYYTVDTNGDYAFTGVIANQALKAQAYVTYTSVVTGESVTRYSNTVTNVVE